ncbi:MAG TPA: ribbon-helix-helix protein, CopG family [Azospirillum sp.]|nr:ribbon-helix-helix protein, CopG family [Azospirillum sp.]
MPDIRLPEDIERRLQTLADRTGRSMDETAREAILSYIEDMEDAELARGRLERGGPRVTLDSLERELGLED